MKKKKKNALKKKKKKQNYLQKKKKKKNFFTNICTNFILENNLVKYALAERNVLSVTNHPFIVKLNYAF